MNNNYNGWTNYETWAVALWLTNDQGMYEYVKGLNENFECSSAYELGEVIKNEIVEEQLEELNIPNSMFSDLIRSSIERVNWTEVAESFLED